MKRGGVVAIGAAVISAAVLIYLTSRGTVDILSPAGAIADSERRLIIFAASLSLVVIIPVFALTAWIVWRYRATNHHTVYDPDWDHNRVIESIWWLIPSMLIAILAVVAWRSSHALDPSATLSSNRPPINVQVVALQWKWLFLYPEQGVASVNNLMLPVGRVAHFDITADAPMNSFWIPQLGGQIYAMPGMSTQLSLEADRAGTFRGSSANISGTGFADMDFRVQATSADRFQSWVSGIKKQSSPLSERRYQQLRNPSQHDSETFGSYAPGLYQSVIDSYMHSGVGA